MAEREAGDRTAQIRVGPLAVPQDRQGEEASGAGRDRRRLGVEPSEVGRGRPSPPAAVEQPGQPGDRRAGRVDPGLGRERARDDVRVVGHRQDVERRRDRRVQAGRRAGHLAHRPGRDDAGAERAGLAVRPAEDDRQARRQAGPRGQPRPERPQHRARRPDRREEARIEVEVGEQPGVPVAPAQVVGERGRRMGAVGRRGPGQGQGDEVARLEGEPGPSEGRRLVAAQPEQLRRDVEGRRQVAGPAVDLPVAVPRPDLVGLAVRPVVAVDQPRRDGLAAAVDEDDRRALAGEAHCQDLVGPPEAASCQAIDEVGQRADRGRPPGAPVLLGPALARRAGRVAAAGLEQPPAVEVEGRRAGPGRADIDGDEHARRRRFCVPPAIVSPGRAGGPRPCPARA